METHYNEKKCEQFYWKVKGDLLRGVAPPPDGDFPDAPENFKQYMKDHPELQSRLQKSDIGQKVICWNCEKEYPIRDIHCPFCGKFNSKRCSIR
jgi:hypothetical protein